MKQGCSWSLPLIHHLMHCVCALAKGIGWPFSDHSVLICLVWIGILPGLGAFFNQKLSLGSLSGLLVFGDDSESCNFIPVGIVGKGPLLTLSASPVPFPPSTTVPYQSSCLIGSNMDWLSLIHGISLLINFVSVGNCESLEHILPSLCLADDSCLLLN